MSGNKRFTKIKNMKSLIDTGRTTGNVWMKTHRAAWWLRRLILEPLTLAGRIDNWQHPIFSHDMPHGSRQKLRTWHRLSMRPAPNTETRVRAARGNDLSGWKMEESKKFIRFVESLGAKNSELQMTSADLAQLISVPASHKDMKGLSSHRQI